MHSIRNPAQLNAGADGIFARSEELGKRSEGVRDDCLVHGSIFSKHCDIADVTLVKTHLQSAGSSSDVEAGIFSDDDSAVKM